MSRPRALMLVTGLAAAGCLQPIDDGFDESSPFIDAGSGGGTGGGGTNMPPMCPNIETDLFQKTCGLAGCHNPFDRASGLDLASPGVANRIRSSVGLCLQAPLRVLIPNKLSASPWCGARMPLGGVLPPQLIDCVQQYLDNL